MRAIATADLHGHLPEIEACDLLLIAGDVCPSATHAIDDQRRWLEGEFAEWIQGDHCRAEQVVWIAGNHDRALDFGGPPRRLRAVATYLLDESVEVGGLKIYGTPWSEILGPAFSLEERMTPDRRYPSRPKLDLEVAFSRIPTDADVVLCHSPPRRILDRAVDGAYLGSLALLLRLAEVRPRLVVFGHIHEAYGRRTQRFRDELGREHPVVFANVAHLDERFRPKNPPQAFEL